VVDGVDAVIVLEAVALDAVAPEAVAPGAELGLLVWAAGGAAAWRDEPEQEVIAAATANPDRATSRRTNLVSSFRRPSVATIARYTRVVEECAELDF
jgi:hypothetical protein